MSGQGPGTGGEPRAPSRRGKGSAAEPPVLPDRAADDADTGWGERVEDDDERWHAERPPHWE